MLSRQRTDANVNQKPCPQKNVHSAAARCTSGNRKQSCASPAIRMPRRARRASGSVLIAIILKKPKKNGK